jgi:hypothetical protein
MMAKSTAVGDLEHPFGVEVADRLRRRNMARTLIDVRRPKIKHLIGLYRDSPLYPEADDLEYAVLKWFHLDGGKDFIHVERRLDETGKPIIDDKTLVELLGSKADFEQFVGSKLIVHKATNFTRYFELAETETYTINT